VRQPAWLRPLLVVVLLVWFLGRVSVDLVVDGLWFESLGYFDAFARMVGGRVGLVLGAGTVAAVFIALNLRWAARRAPLNLARIDELLVDLRPGTERLQSLVRLVLAAAVVLPAVLLGVRLAPAWKQLLLAMSYQPVGQHDPVFGLDMGVHLFVLPWLEVLHQQLSATLTLTAMLVGGWYVLRDFVLSSSRGPAISETARRHGLVLLALMMLSSAMGTWLDRYAVLTQQNGFVWGAGHADVVARIPGLTAAAVLSVAVAVALLALTRRPGLSLPAGLVIASVVLRTLLVGVIPNAVQDWVVRPNELDLEREYLARSIEATRTAYALDRIEVRPFEAGSELTLEEMAKNALTVENIRIWDDRPLLTTYGQLQEIRLYYDFVDVDIDRYTIDGEHRQVMLAARELNASNLPSQARNWVNEHLHYTHGYGLTISPVNVVTPEGLPELLIRDIPPAIDPLLVESGITIDRPEIYFGELTDRYALVKTGAEEFDYPAGDQNAYTRYAGTGGVAIGSIWRRVLFAAHLRSMDILLTRYLTEESEILFRRQIAGRVASLVPFLQLDRDPYIVIHDGRLVWILDGYTTSSAWPYSEPFKLGRSSSFNYIRNSVKVVVDAYNGSIDLYVSDPSDPIITAWQRALPGVFKDIGQLPEGLSAHLRYPTDFFDVQSHLYRAYHMNEPTVFYNKEDMWEVPRELYGGQEQVMESYYLTMRLPDEPTEEFILLIPFVPTNRDNMIAWLAARSDGDQYGSLILYQFPKQKLLYGPRQVESRIDQDPVISQQISLWSQSGSRVVRGNLLVVPIADTLLYVEPLYLQSETSQLPELKRVIVSYGNRIVMEETLPLALEAIFGSPPEATASAPRGPESPRGPVEDGTGQEPWSELARQAQETFLRATTLQRQGDWAAYGQALAELEAVLARLTTLAEPADVPLEQATIPAEPAPVPVGD